MTISRAAKVLLCLLLVPGMVSASEALRVGGSLGFGMTARHQGGDFDWDFDSGREDVSLAQFKFGFSPIESLSAFLRFGARLEESSAMEGPRLELQEAALRFRHSFSRDDRLEVTYFALQPSNLWLDHGLRAPVTPDVAAGRNVQGVRAQARWSFLEGIFVAAHRDRSESGEETVPDGDVILFRLRGDVGHSRIVRVGTSFVRENPSSVPLRGDPTLVDALHRDLYGIDIRFLWSKLLFQIDYSQVTTSYLEPAAEALQEPGLRSGWDWQWSRRLTDIMPSTAALRAEVRTTGVGNPRWGWFGFAPTFRALGAHHTNRLVAVEADPGSPRRGLEGYRLEAWYEASVWPLWIRQVYDRHTEFRDANRRIIRQVSEVEGLLSNQIRTRLRYVQQQMHEPLRQYDEHHDDLLLEIRAEDSASRLRAQLAFLDLNSERSSEVLALEATARISGRFRTLNRVSFTRRHRQVQHGLFSELQYWHLPEFEVALSYGPEGFGDRVDPALDADLTAAADQRDVVRLHFRGWF